MPERKTLNEDLFPRGSSANLPRLHRCENEVLFWDFSQFAVTLYTLIKIIPEVDQCNKKMHSISQLTIDRIPSGYNNQYLSSVTQDIGKQFLSFLHV